LNSYSSIISFRH